MAPVHAQQAPSGQAPAQPGRPVTRDEAIAERDRLIETLRRRIQVLESERNGRPKAAPPATAAQPDRPDPATEPALRALERTLTREGAMVLPRGSFEVEPALTYTHRSRSAEPGQWQEEIEGQVALRAGLPGATQLELVLPYRHVRQEPGAGVPSASASGRGSASIGLTRQLLDEGARRPGLLGTLRWTEGGGQPGLSTRGAHASLEADLTAVTRQDPAVFFGGVGLAAFRSRSLQGQRIAPGKSATLHLGSVIALRPETSLLLGMEIERSQPTRIDGMRAPGTRSSVAYFHSGFAFALGSSALLDLRLSVGVTDDSPDYRFTVSLPYRF